MSKRKVVKVLKPVTPKAVFRLDIGCGGNKKEGFIGMDFAGGADIVHDFTKFPWPIETNSVDEVWCSHVFEHVPGPLRGKWMDEMWRIMKEGATATVIVPAYNSARAVQDYTHMWPPIAPESFWYFNRGWREANKLTHGFYDIRCHFEHNVVGMLQGQWTQRHHEAQAFAGLHYMNVVSDLQAILTKRA